MSTYIVNINLASCSFTHKRVLPALRKWAASHNAQILLDDRCELTLEVKYPSRSKLEHDLSAFTQEPVRAKVNITEEPFD